jgi:lipopolysaccharide/colanic/teichoic acid biosynthesis glycosyltransferase
MMGRVITIVTFISFKYYFGSKGPAYYYQEERGKNKDPTKVKKQKTRKILPGVAEQRESDYIRTRVGQDGGKPKTKQQAPSSQSEGG